jgi:hypothetical protein
VKAQTSNSLAHPKSKESGKRLKPQDNRGRPNGRPLYYFGIIRYYFLYGAYGVMAALEFVELSVRVQIPLGTPAKIAFYRGDFLIQ